jgi:hypothetical protein
MSVYGASFVRAAPDWTTTFQRLSRLLRDMNESWLAASPTNLAMERIIQASEQSDWISIQSPLDDHLLETISRALGTTAIMIYMMDEMRLRFSYRRFDHGSAVRALQYLDDGNPRARGKWTRVEGEPEQWEAILFSPPLIEQYRTYAPDEVAEGCADNKIKPGFSIPQPCYASTIAEITRALQLPWDPIENRFPPATQTEVIPGSPERWKAFHHQHRRPWWKFWGRD